MRQVGMHENEGRGSERVIADDLVVSSTPRRIRRTSNSSADRYRVPGGLAREGGLRQGARGWKKQRGERGRRDGGGKGVAEWMSAEENERASGGVCGVRGWPGAHGDASGVFLWRRELSAGVAWRGGKLPPRHYLSFSRVLLLFLSFFVVANFWFSQSPIPPEFGPRQRVPLFFSAMRKSIAHRYANREFFGSPRTRGGILSATIWYQLTIFPITSLKLINLCYLDIWI